jgi:transcription initiation factor TFIIF subunit beta
MISEKTKIVGKIHYDMRVEPVDKREEEKLLERRLFEADNSKPGVQLITRDRTVKAMQSSNPLANKWGDQFIVSLSSQEPQSLYANTTQKNSAPVAKPKKGEIFKAARIPENELIDLFWKCFGEYQFWSMKALRQRLQQPENYIRQVLNDREIAVLHKSGPFANHYELTDQYKSGIHAQKSAAAAEEDDDDEGEEMEDVMPTS